jgi:hypothetical protein
MITIIQTGTSMITDMTIPTIMKTITITQTTHTAYPAGIRQTFISTQTITLRAWILIRIGHIILIMMTITRIITATATCIITMGGSATPICRREQTDLRSPGARCSRWALVGGCYPVRRHWCCC